MEDCCLSFQLAEKNLVKQLKDSHRRLQSDAGKDSTFVKPATTRTVSEERKPLRDLSPASPQKFAHGSGSCEFLFSSFKPGRKWNYDLI